MKPVAFDLQRPASLDAAAALLAQGGSQALGGGQSLGPMLNLRVARPERLVDLSAVPDLRGVEVLPDALRIGAGVTHAAIADGLVPDIGPGMLARVAQGIAYRAVRTRGTIGGSLAHADPGADWPCALAALGASALTWSAAGRRRIPVARFMLGPFRTALNPGELILAVEVPRPSPQARFGYVKVARKPGEFAQAIGAVLVDGTARRAAIGAVEGPPLLLEGADVSVAGAAQALAACATLDAIDRRIHAAAFRRALAEVTA